MDIPVTTTTQPGECLPWDQKLKELPPVQGDAELMKRVWQDVDAMAYVYIWHVVLSF